MVYTTTKLSSIYIDRHHHQQQTGIPASAPFGMRINNWQHRQSAGAISADPMSWSPAGTSAHRRSVCNNDMDLSEVIYNAFYCE